MRCPYCASQIDDAALACPHCTRDLYLFRPLLARIEAEAAAIASLSARLEDLGVRIVGARADAAPADGSPDAGPAHPGALGWVRQRRPRHEQRQDHGDSREGPHLSLPRSARLY